MLTEGDVMYVISRPKVFKAKTGPYLSLKKMDNTPPLTRRRYSHRIAEESIWIFSQAESRTNPWNPILHERCLARGSSARQEEEEEEEQR
jgi:hypothetical protein